ncbi:MAG: autoinducer 2-degrading protein [Alphaproteobacteria bacterium]|jgi:autoinducer 2-degrading protein
MRGSMYVVTVNFEIEPAHVDGFRTAVMRQAENSVSKEPDCHRFDVSVDGADPAKFFLYEIYTDEAAFQAHLKTAHYADFNATTTPWVKAKAGTRFESVLHIPAHG